MYRLSVLAFTKYCMKHRSRICFPKMKVVVKKQNIRTFESTGLAEANFLRPLQNYAYRTQDARLKKSLLARKHLGDL